MNKANKYRQELFKKLLKSPNLRKERALLSQLFKQSIFWIIQGTDIDAASPLANKFVCPNAKQAKTKACQDYFKQALNQARKTRKAEQFICPGHLFGTCLPLVQGDALYGFLIFCHLDSRPSHQLLQLFEALNSTILEKIQKELELSKLYQTIRPRAIALSTVHTIRRLISSSLDIDELLPRIARLTLQVLRAKYCSISLVDKESKRLASQVFIDLSKKKHKPNNSSAMKKIEYKVLRSSNALLKKTYLSMPLIDEEPIGVITVSDKMGNKAFNNFDQEILTALAEQAVGAIKNAQLYKEQENILLGTVKSLSSLLKTKSTYPYAHSKIFLEIVLELAKELRLSEENLRDLRVAAMLHDAGEIGVPEEILRKPRQLTGEEFEIVKEHPKKSAKILSPLQRLKGAIAIIMHHHEKFDGSGYPDQLKGQAIPLGARIMSVADSFEAMISRRPYRKSASAVEAIQELKRLSGTQFDPRVIKAFLKLTKTKFFKRLLKANHG